MSCYPRHMRDAKGKGKGRGPGGSGADRDVLRFAFECPRSWDALAPTDDPKVKHCDHCDQAVYLCADAQEARVHARVKRCVAVPVSGSPYRGVVEVPRTVVELPRAIVVQHGRKPVSVTMGSVMPDDGGESVVHLGWLVPLGGPQRGQVFRLGDGTTIIGSGVAAHVRLEDDPEIQPEHCRIVATRDRAWVLTGGGFQLVGAQVGGRPMDRYQLCDGDVFVVGKTSVVFKALW